MRNKRYLRPVAAATVLLITLLWVLVGTVVRAQQVTLGKEAYLMPPKEIADAVLSSRQENITLTKLSPDGKKFLITKNDGLPPLERLARACVHLGEAVFDPTACRSRDLWVRSNAGYDIFYFAEKRTVPLQIPDRARASNAIWSPDGSKLAFYGHFEEATHIYIADAETGFSRRLTVTPVLATLATSFQWSRDGQRIQTVLLPDDGQREMPKRNGVATEPKVRISRGGSHPSRTYRYLLETPYDIKLLEHLATGQLALIDLSDGKVTKIGFPNLIRNVSMAPGEGEFRITTVKKPFSYFVPLTRFGTQEGIWNLEGKCLYTLADRKLQETEPQPPAPTVVAGGQPRAPGQPRAGRGARNPAQTPAPDPMPLDPDPAPNPDPNPDPDFSRRGARPVDPDARRDIGWRPDGAGLSFLQLEPAQATELPISSTITAALLVAPLGQMPFLAASALIRNKTAKESTVARKDRVLQWLPPFGKADEKVIYETAQRISSLQYSDDCRMLFLTQTIDNQRQIIAVDLNDPTKTAYPIHKSAARDGNADGTAANSNPPTIGENLTPLEFADGDRQELAEEEQQRGRGRGFGGGSGLTPGLMTRSSRSGVLVVRVSSMGDVYITGSDRSAGGETRLPRPYIDKINIKTGKKARIFEGKGDMMETIDAVDGDDIKLVFTTRQKADVVPDSYVHDLQSGKVTKLTNNVNQTPWYNELKTQRLQVTRVDGFKFWVKVTTPPKPDGKLPSLFWIYPREYASQAAYNSASSRNTANSNRFAAPTPRSMTLLTLLGYAVVEPDIPIVGPAGRINDNYVPDLRNSLWAVIDELDKRGIIDRDRLAVGGHSYGAFSTANVLAHTPFFKAGIAGDGNYNRTLTTMTFQTERRQLWDARETYLEMSPLLWANRVNGALLMYHGMEDANVGTNPINAEHMFMALDGLGKPAALYMYPYEGHGPLARETTLDLWARWVAWLDTHVKNAKQEKKQEKK